MKIFSKRLKSLRKENGITQEKLAKILNYSRSTVTKYESGHRIPSKNFLIDIADYFEVSIDYLLDRTNIRLGLQEYLSKYSPSVIVFVNPKNGKIIDHSPSVLDFYGYTSEELLEMTIFDLNTLPKDKLYKLMVKARNRKHLTFNTKHKLANGEIKNVKITTTSLMFGSEKIMAALVKDLDNILQRKYLNKIDPLFDSMSKINYKKLPYKKYFAKNVSQLSVNIGKRLSLANESLHSLKIASLLHDIGEIHIPASIINKPDNLLEHEFEFIRKHPEFGYETFENVFSNNKIAEIILQHHERLDGSGYPKGLKSESILTEAKIIAVTDTIVSMLSKRPYRGTYNKKQIIEELNKYKNIKYDKEIVKIGIDLLSDKDFNIKKQKSLE